MENQLYQDPILKKYGQLMEASKMFKQIYYGDPVRIGASSLPALIIAKLDTKVSFLTNAEDRHDMRISFTVVTDVRDTISEDKEMVRGVNSLYNLIEGRQESTLNLKANTLLYILRHNAVVDAANNLRTDLSSTSNISYGMTVGKRKEDAYGLEGVLEITASFTQVR